MKKFFTLIVMALMAVGVNAETLPWEGEVVFDNWGANLQVDKSVFASAKAGDKIMITAAPVEVSTWEWGAQVYLKTLRGGWAIICNTIAATEEKTYSVEITDDEIEIEEEKEDKSKVTVKTTMLSELKEYGLAIQGMASKITKVELYSVPEYEETGTSLEFNEWGQIFKSQLADYSGDDKIVITYKIEGSTDYEEGGTKGSVIGWGIGSIASLGGKVKLADLSIQGIGEYSISFTMNELADALDDTNTEYNTNGFGVQFWSCKNATGSLVSIVAYKVKAAAEEVTWTVVGVKNIFGSEWNTEDANNDMISTDGKIYTWVKEDVTLEKGTEYKFKVAKNHSWGEAYPSSDYIFKVDETAKYTITITFDSESKEVSVKTEKTGDAEAVEHTYDVRGNFKGDEKWEISYEMTKGSDGIFTVSIADVDKGNYEYKVRQDNAWSVSYPSSNATVEVKENGSTVTITFDPSTNTVNATVTAPTGITAVKTAQQDGVRYNLAGQKVNAGYKGVVIMNGKKFVVK